MVGETVYRHKVILFLLAVLILSSLATAEIYSFSATGKDGVSGIVRMSDTVTIRTISMMPCVVDTKGEGNFTAMTCSQTNPAECSISYPVALNGTNAAANVLIKETNTGQQKTVRFFLDNTAPSIQSFSMQSTGGGVIAYFRAQDQGSLQFPNNCSGIEKAELYLNGKLSGTSNHNAGTCSINSNVTGTVSNFAGTVTTQLVLYDYLDQKITRNGTPVEIDSRPPRIVTSAEIYIGETKLTKIPPNTSAEAALHVKINSEAGISASNVYANVSDLGSSDVTAASCSQDDNGTYVCVLPVSAKFTKSNPKVTVFAVDNKGNKANQSISIQLTLAAPKITATGIAYEAGTEEKLSYVPGQNSTKTLSGDLVVTMTYDNSLPFAKATADLSRISTATEMPTARCTQDEENHNKYLCKISSVPLRIKETRQGRGTATVFVTDASGNVANATVSFGLNTLSTGGIVQWLGPEGRNCQVLQCFLSGSGQGIIVSISSQVGFADDDVYINSAKAKCEQNSSTLWRCSATPSIGAGGLVVNGSDVLGNRLSGRANVTVDSTPPQITSFTVNGSLDDLVEGDKIFVTALVKEQNMQNATADVTEISNEPQQTNFDHVPIAFGKLAPGTCRQVGSAVTWNCTWTIIVEKETYVRATVPILIYDKAGNLAKKEIAVTVKQLTDETPDFWNISATYSPKQMNRRLLQYYPKQVLLDFKLTTKTGDAKIMKVGTVGCAARSFNNSGRMDTKGVDALLPVQISQNAAKTQLIQTAPINVGAYKNLSELQWTCVFEITTSTGTKVYKKPELELYTLSIALDDSPLMSDKVNEEILRSRDELNGSYTKTILFLDKWINRINSICGTTRTAATVMNTCNWVQVASIWPGVSDAARKCNEKSGDATRSTLLKVAKGICDFTSCNANYNNYLYSKFPGTGKIADWMAEPAALAGLDPTGSLTEASSPEARRQAAANLIASSSGPQDSFVSAVMNLCVPGMIYNLKKLQVMKCERLSCLERDVPLGVPPSECEKIYNYNKCVFEWGNLVSTPWISMTTYVTNQAKQIASDPAATIGMGAYMLTCRVIPEAKSAGVCTLPKAVSTLSQITKMIASSRDAYNSFKKLKDPATGESREPSDVCKEILDRPSFYLALPFDIRNSKLTACSSNPAICPGQTEGTATDLNGNVLDLNSFTTNTGQVAISAANIQASYAELQKKEK